MTAAPKIFDEKIVPKGGIDLTQPGVELPSSVVASNYEGSLTLIGAERTLGFVTTKGDAHTSFAVTAAGAMSWGVGGSTAPDTTLARTGVEVLTLTGKLTATGKVSAAQLGAAGFATSSRNLIGMNAVLDSSDPTTTADFIAADLNTTFTGSGWVTTTAPDAGFYWGSNLYTQTGNKAGDGTGMANTVGCLIEFDVRAPISPYPEAAPFSGRFNMQYVFGGVIESAFEGASAASTVYQMVGLRVGTPSYKSVLTTRAVNDGKTTEASKTIESATAAFKAEDEGVKIVGNGIPYGTTIEKVTSATVASISKNATATATKITLAIGNGGVVLGPVYGLYISAAEGAQVGSTNTYALYVEAGNSVLNGPVKMDLTQMTGLNLNGSNMDMRSGINSPAIGIKVPSTFQGRLIDIFTNVGGFQLFNVTNEGKVQSAQTITANLAKTGLTAIGGVGPSEAGGIKFGVSGGLDSTIYRAAANVFVFGTATIASPTGLEGPAIMLANATKAPSGTPTGAGVLYSEAGALKYKGTSGTVTELAKA